MANTGDIHGLFWDDENGDRTYESSSFERWLKKFFTTGVFLNDLMVSASDGMTIGVSGGYANVDGKVRFWDNTTNFTLEPANSTYPRIDTIVITRDEVERTVQLEAVKGQYSGNNPVATAPIRNTEKHQLVIAQILVSAGVTTITQADITDTRADSELCGIVACAVEKYDFGQWSAQFRAEIAQFKGENLEAFTTWFNNIKGQLSTDAAGHLQNEIDKLAESLNASAIHYNNANSDLTATDVQSAIDEVKEITDDVKADITNNVKPKVATLEEELTANGNRIYMDYKNGKYGYNTSPTRGADTFTPFKNLDDIKRYLPKSFGINVSGSGMPHNCGGSSSTSIISPADGTLTLTFSESARYSSPSDGFTQYGGASATCHGVTVGLGSDGAHSGTLRIYENETINLSISSGNIDRSSHNVSMGLSWNFD